MSAATVPVPVPLAAGASPAVLAATAEATAALTRAAGRSPRFAIGAFSVVSIVALGLGYLYLTKGRAITHEDLDTAMTRVMDRIDRLSQRIDSVVDAKPR